MNTTIKFWFSQKARISELFKTVCAKCISLRMYCRGCMISVEQTVGFVGWNLSYNTDRFMLQRNVNTDTTDAPLCVPLQPILKEASISSRLYRITFWLRWDWVCSSNEFSELEDRNPVSLTAGCTGICVDDKCVRDREVQIRESTAHTPSIRSLLRPYIWQVLSGFMRVQLKLQNVSACVRRVVWTSKYTRARYVSTQSLCVA